MKNKMRSFYTIWIIIAIVTVMPACKKNKDEDDVIVIKATGNITTRLNEFRQILGATLNTTPGVTGGRREINWDGVPDSLLDKAMPVDFFNPAGSDASLAIFQRGLVYDTIGDFIVTNDQFASVNSEATAEFEAFSGNKTFANVNATLWEIDPQVAGSSLAATINGFGIVFSDVDVANSTFIEFFHDNESLGKFFVPVHDNTNSISFLGVYFKNKKVTHLRVGHDGKLSDGEKDITSGGTKDLVIMDDFLYDEPVKR